MRLLRRGANPASHIRLTVTNSTKRSLRLSLEPLGYYHELAPGETRIVNYELGHEPRLEIGVNDDGVAIWDETGAAGDGLLFEGEGHSGAS